MSTRDIQPVRSIVPGESTSLLFPQKWFEEYIACDVTIQVNYTPVFGFWKDTDYFRFITLANATGGLDWFPKAISEPIASTPGYEHGLQILPYPADDPSHIGLIITN